MSENGGFEAVWLYIKALLPPGLDGALEPGGRENGRGSSPRTSTASTSRLCPSST